MDLLEDLLPHAGIRCRLFLCVEGIQGRVAVEVNVVSIGRDLVACQQDGIVGVVAKVFANSAMSYLPATAPVGGRPFPQARRSQRTYLAG